MRERNRKKMKTPLETRQIERVSYSFYFLGQGFVYTIVAQHLMFYYTEYAFLPPLVISAILFFEKIWDAINDALFGILMDKVRFKSGLRFLPWLRTATILLPISTILLFSIQPSLSLQLRITIAILTYALWDVAYTMCDAPIYALSTAMTSDVKERAYIMTYSSLGGTIAAGLSTIVLVPFFQANGFFTTAIVVAVIALITMNMITITGKERHHFKEEKESLSLKESWDYVKQNKYLLIFFLYRLISGSIAIQTLNYVTKYCFGNVNYVSYIALTSIIPIIILYSSSQKLLRRFNKIQLLRFSILITICLYGLNLIFGKGNDYVYITLMAGVALMAIFPSILFGSIPSDCIEYMTFKTGNRKEGITFSLNSFVAKTCAAFASVVTGAVLAYIGYESGAAGMTMEMRDQLWIFSCLIPMIGLSLGYLILHFYNLKDDDVQIMADANAGKISKEEAYQKLSKTYD